MKRIFAIIALVVISMFAIAQTNQLVWANGQLIYGTPIESIDSLTCGEMEDVDTLYLLYSTSIGRIDSLTYGEMEDVDTLYLLLPRTNIKVVHDTIYIETPENSENPGMENGHEWVDLGLSVKWATCNVGATKPEEHGDYFAWGEVEPKEDYAWNTYKHSEGSKLIKYTGSDKTVLGLEDDAAAVNWGGAWRIPTIAELDELKNNCTWNWTTQNGVNGYRVIGPNGNSIFLPITGFMYGKDLTDDEWGFYWSNAYGNGAMSNASSMFFISNIIEWNHGARRYGQPVRPVCQ